MRFQSDQITFKVLFSRKFKKMAGTNGRSGGDRKSEGADRTKPDGGPLKPSLSASVGKKWDELIEQLPAGSLRKIDAHELRILSELLAMADSLAESCRRDPSDLPTVRAFVNVSTQIHRLSASFGLNPGDRKRLALAPPEQEESELSALLKRRMAPKEN
jgi:phage terminase small subunit